MIEYTEKGAGLHAAISAAGHWLMQVDGVWRSSNDAAVQAISNSYTVAQAIAWRQAQSLAHAKALRDRAVASVSAGEMAAWPIKREEAQRYAQTGNPADAPMLSAEAAARGISLSAMLAKVQANAQRFAALEAQIGGADGKHRDALAALTTFEAVEAYDLTVGWPEV